MTFDVSTLKRAEETMDIARLTVGTTFALFQLLNVFPKAASVGDRGVQIQALRRSMNDKGLRLPKVVSAKLTELENSDTL